MFYLKNGVLVGFNVWPVLLVASIIIMMIVGLFQYNLVDGRVHRRFNTRFIQLWAFVLSAIIEFFMVVEMGQGAALEIGSFLGAIMGFSIIGMLMITLLWGIAETVGKSIKGKLKACLR